jgi:ankyrin repeat protein
VHATQAPRLGPAPVAILGEGGDGGDKGERLRVAAREGHVKTVEELLSGPQPPPIDAPDPATQRTPLMEAAEHANASVVAVLVHRGAGVNARDSQGFTPLMLAARSGSLTQHDKSFLAVQALFNWRRNSALPTLDACSTEGFTALMYAAS